MILSRLPSLMTKWRGARLSSSCRSSEALITCSQVRSPSSVSFRRSVYVSDLGFVPKSKSGPHVNTNPKPHQMAPAPVMEDTATADSLQAPAYFPLLTLPPSHRPLNSTLLHRFTHLVSPASNDFTPHIPLPDKHLFAPFHPHFLNQILRHLIHALSLA